MNEHGIRVCWPMNMPFDVFDPQAGERALAESELFRREHLRLLCGAVCADLSAPEGDCQWPRVLQRERLDYLVCRGDAVLLAIEITDRDAWRGSHARLDGCLTFRTSASPFSKGEVGEILAMLEAVTARGDPPEWYCHLEPCPPELTGELFRQSMLECRREGTAPTEYGSLYGGLIRVFQDGRSQAMCTARTARRLPVLLAADREPALSRQDGIPFQQLLADYRAGVSSDEGRSGELVGRVGEMTLEAWMRGLPDQLRQMRALLPDWCVTFEDAALATRDMLCNGDWERYYQGVELMRLMAATLRGDQTMVNAVRLGRRVTGRRPDNMPKRYQSEEGSIRPLQSFQDRISRLNRWLPDSARLAMGTQERFFQGVAALTRSGYPRWLAGMLRTYLELPPRCPYVDLLHMAEDSLDKDDQWMQDVGVHMLYLLLIEPYCLIAQEKKRHDRKEVSHQ